MLAEAAIWLLIALTSSCCVTAARFCTAEARLVLVSVMVSAVPLFAFSEKVATPVVLKSVVLESAVPATVLAVVAWVPPEFES